MYHPKNNNNKKPICLQCRRMKFFFLLTLTFICALGGSKVFMELRGNVWGWLGTEVYPAFLADHKNTP